MAKPTIFISHITEEAPLAQLFKSEIEQAFLGMVDVFVSSAPESLAIGKNWLNTLTENVRNCAAMLLVVSPVSVQRPWINFEFGAAWGRDVEIVPICHSGLRPADLPLPMRVLQGCSASDAAKVGELFQLVARTLGSCVPTIDVGAIVARVRGFEHVYGHMQAIVDNLLSIRRISPTVFAELAKGCLDPVDIESARQSEIDKLSPFLDSLQQRGVLKWSYRCTGTTSPGPGGSGGVSIGTLTVTGGPHLAAWIPTHAVV